MTTTTPNEPEIHHTGHIRHTATTDAELVVAALLRDLRAFDELPRRHRHHWNRRRIQRNPDLLDRRLPSD